MSNCFTDGKENICCVKIERSKKLLESSNLNAFTIFSAYVSSCFIVTGYLYVVSCWAFKNNKFSNRTSHFRSRHCLMFSINILVHLTLSVLDHSLCHFLYILLLASAPIIPYLNFSYFSFTNSSILMRSAIT